MLNKVKNSSLMAMLIACMMIGNSFVVMAGTAPPPDDGVNGMQYIDGDWSVNSVISLTDEQIVLSGNLIILPGGSLTLTNTSIWMNCTYPGQYGIDVQGTLVLRDGGDGISPNQPGDSDASIISASNSADRPHFRVRNGATFDAKNSVISYIGEDPSGVPGELIGGDMPEDELSVWNNIRNGSFRITIEGVSADISDLNFTNAGSLAAVAAIIQNGIRAVGTGGFSLATCTWTGVEFRIESGINNVDVLNVHESSVAKLEAHSMGNGTDISGLTESQQAILSGGSLREINMSRWNAVTDGTFRITIDGTTRDIGPLNFVGAANMNAVALRIQNAMQATGGPFYNAGCEWNGAYFIFTSGATGTATTISQLSTHGGALGTDISGIVTSAGASLWGDTDEENNFASWSTVTDGEFGISIDGNFQNIGPINFAGVADMYDVAARIQTALRAVGTGGFTLATCTWNTARFIITAGTGTTVGTITSCIPTGTGTDISGATGSSHTALMNCGPAGDLNLTHWGNITNGTFQISIDGVAANVGPLNFSGVASMIDVATIIHNGLVPAGFPGATCTWATGDHFLITSPTNSIITNVSALTAGIGGTDISGAAWMNGLAGIETVIFTQFWMDCNTGTMLSVPYRWLDCAANGTLSMTAQRWWLDCAANATEDPMYTSNLGIYIQSNQFSLENSLVQDCQNGLMFDSCYPALLQNNNITNTNGIGILVFNLTNPNYAIAGATLSNNNVIDNNENGVLIIATTIEMDVFNMNVSENAYGLAILGETTVDVNVYDSEFYFNYAAWDYPAVQIFASGWESTTTAVIEDNIVYGNDCSGVWVGYDDLYTRSNHTVVNMNRNILMGNHYGEVFQAHETLFVHAEDNFFGASEITGSGDGMNIGNSKGLDCMDNDVWTKNVTMEIINNVFDYDFGMTSTTDYREICGVMRTGALWNMDATVIGNEVKGSDNVAFGGIFLMGTPTPSFNEIPRTRYLTVYFEGNDVRTFMDTIEPSIGGVYVFSAMENADVTMIDNSYFTTAGGTGGIIEVQGGSPDYGMGLKNSTVVLRGNEIFADPNEYGSGSGGGGGIGGFVRIHGDYSTDVTIEGNSFTYADYESIADTGGVIRIGRHDEYAVMQHSARIALNDNLFNIGIDDGNSVGGIVRIAPFHEMDVSICRNDVYMNLWNSEVGGIFGVGIGGNDEFLPNAFNMTLVVEYNTIAVRSFSDSGSGELGGVVRAFALNNMDVKINHNYISILMYDNDKLSGVFWVGKKGDSDTAFNLTIEVKFNNFDITARDTEINGIMRIYAYMLIDADISNNEISIFSDDGIGGVLWLGDWSNDTDCDYERFDLETYLIFNNNNIHAQMPYDMRDVGGALRITGREVTDVTMMNNVIEANYFPAPVFIEDEDEIYDFGVRIGKRNFCDDSQALVSNHTNVYMYNNIIGAGKGSALLIAGYHMDVTIEGGSIYGALYDNWRSNEYSQGNGISLYNKPGSMTATISGVNIFGNRGAGIYIETPNAADINILNSDITGNNWGGIMFNGQEGADITGIIDNCNLVGNGLDTLEMFDSTFGIEFHHATMMLRNSSLANPGAALEMRIMDDSHVTSLNTYFNKDRAKVLGTPAILTGGLQYESSYQWYSCYMPDWNYKWNDQVSDGTFRITIDGFSADIGPIDFNGVGSNINNVAQRIEDAIRAVPGAPDGFKNATVDYTVGTGFRITSGTIGPNSNITRLETHSGGIGTDISGNARSTNAHLLGTVPMLDIYCWGSWTTTWRTISNGTFNLTIDGFSADIGPINFTTIGGRFDVLTYIQNAIRTVPGAPVSFTNAEVLWWRNSNRMIIVSGSDNVTSTVQPLATHSASLGTDISGNTPDPWGSNYMGCGLTQGVSQPAKSWLDMAGATSTVVNGTVGTSNLLVQWYLDAKVVRDDNGLAIPDATVTIRNSSNTIVGTGATGLDGWFRGTIANEYLQTSTTKTLYTPHTVSATKGLATGTVSPNIDMSKTVTISLDYTPAMPVADAGMNISVLTGFDAVFNGTNSTGEPPLTYVWTFNNSVANITLNGAVAAFNCTVPAITPGMYNVTLTVTDYWGNQANDTLVLTVIDSNSPMANAGPDQTVNEDTTVTFNGTASSDPVGVTNYTWTFVDVTAKTLYGVAPTYIFTQPGVYLVTLNVLDGEGNNGTDNLTVTVRDVTAPIANAGPDQTIPEGGQAQFTAAASSDNVQIVSYEWTFTDGSNIVKLFGMNPTYSFLVLGSYEVTLVVFDAAGNSGSDIMWVHVVDVTSPNVLLMAPGENLAGVPIDWSLVIVFDEPMNQSSAEAAISISGGINITGFAWDASGRYVTIAFSDFAYNTTYTVTVATTANDISGNPLTAAYTTTFTTMPKSAEPVEPEEPEEPETNFFTNNWWILVVIIVVLAVLLLVSLLRGKGEAAAPAAEEVPPTPPEGPAAEPAPAEPVPEALAEEEIQ